MIERILNVNKNELLQTIERKRGELNQSVSKYGLASSTTLRISQELDHLLNLYNDYYNRIIQEKALISR